MSAENEPTLTDKALAALRRAVAGVVEDARRRGVPLAVWRDGKVVMEMPPAVDAVGESRRNCGAGPQPGANDSGVQGTEPEDEG